MVSYITLLAYVNAVAHVNAEYKIEGGEILWSFYYYYYYYYYNRDRALASYRQKAALIYCLGTLVEKDG